MKSQQQQFFQTQGEYDFFMCNKLRKTNIMIVINIHFFGRAIIENEDGVHFFDFNFSLSLKSTRK